MTGDHLRTSNEVRQRLATTDTATEPASGSAVPTDRFRADIQGLRALAVVLVLLYHLWPNRLTGGFAGVDVFFVISGFLITSHLAGRMPTTAGDLGQFWARRIRRLLPAALLVLLATLIASRLFGPETQWDNTARETMAATLYVENWRLAQTAVDYLAADNAPSPVQHYWSLSVEEQFYIVWPVLILVLAFVAHRLGRRPLQSVLVGLVVVVALSFGYSVYATWAEPARAYFVTPTRIWELGIGALLAVGCAVLAQRRDRPLGIPEGRARVILAWLGFTAIAVTAFTFTGETPFPSWRALLPVLGTAAVIAAASAPAGLSPTRLLQWRPVQWMGGISYSVYLWHWPLVALVPAVSGGHLGRLDKAVILVVTLVLAHLTKKYVEDAFRFGRLAPGVRRTYGLAAAAMALLLLLGGLQIAEVQHRQAQAEQELDQALSGQDACFGAAAMNPGRDCAPVPFADIVPAPAQAGEDKSDAYSDNCWVYPPFAATKSCTFGDKNGDVSIALLGNSHAGHWLPTLQEIAKERRWKITTFLASECTPTTMPVEWDAPDHQAGCLDWSERVQQQIIADDFDLVVTSNRNGHSAEGMGPGQSQQKWQQGYREYLEVFDREKIHVSVIHDNPYPGRDIPDCIAQNEQDLDACAGTPEEWRPQDPMVAAAKEIDSSEIRTVDLTKRFCTREKCPAVIGGVLVYFDGSHVSKTYAKTLAPYLVKPLVRTIKE